MQAATPLRLFGTPHECAVPNPCYCELEYGQSAGGIGLFLMVSFWVGFGGSLGSLIFESVLFAVMSDETKEASNRDLLRNSLLYRHFQAEREEILKHKWYESERAGYDIGFDRALADWIIKHRAEWLKRRPSET